MLPEALLRDGRKREELKEAANRVLRGVPERSGRCPESSFGKTSSEVVRGCCEPCQRSLNTACA